MAALASALAQTAPAEPGTDTARIIAGIVSLVLGILILIVPRLLNYIVAAYLIVVGIIWLASGL